MYCAHSNIGQLFVLHMLIDVYQDGEPREKKKSKSKRLQSTTQLLPATMYLLHIINNGLPA